MASEMIDNYIDEHVDDSMEQLARLVAQPSISSQNVGMEACADLVATILEEHGFQARILPGERYPVVYAESGGGSDRTLICYNHYDVQPPEPLEGWDSPPFEATRKGNKVYGRGICDDKGELISRLAALRALREVNGDLPCRVKFLVEGGEEIGSPDIPAFVREHRDLLAADGCVWETGGVDHVGRPQVILGMRGLCYVQLNARAMRRDAHSGGAHVLPNAAWRLVRALNSIKDENERILIPGFYDDAQEPGEAERGLFGAMPNEEAAVKESYGIDSFVLGLTGAAAREAVYGPTANICGLASGYQGPGTKTVIPANAMCKIDFRLIPDQDPEDIAAKLRHFLDDQGFDDIEIEYLGGERAATTPVDDPLVQITLRTAREIYNREPVVVPLVGGSGPMYPFRKDLKVPIVPCGFSYPESYVHAPNENIVIDLFVQATKHMVRITEGFAV